MQRDVEIDVEDNDKVGGFIGTLYIGLFGAGIGWFTGGGTPEQLWKQFAAAAVIAIYSFVMAFIIGFIIQKTMGFRIKNEDAVAGVDTVVHGEEGYALEPV